MIVADHCASSAGKIDLPLDQYHIPMLDLLAEAHPAARSRHARDPDRRGADAARAPRLQLRARFFGRDILTEGKNHQRALIANYQTVGYYEDGLLVELRPQRRVLVVDVATGKEAAPSDRTRHYTDEAIGYYQGASDAFRRGALRQPPRLVRAIAAPARQETGDPVISAAFRLSPFWSLPMAQYVYSMIRVGKVVPPKRQILKDISLSFFPGAKIGVLGLNGSGKSSLLRIMAGVDNEIDGEACRCRASRSATCRRSRSSIPAKTVRRKSRPGLGEVLEAQQKLEEIYAAYAEPDADFDKLADEQAKYEAIIAAAGTDAEHQLEIAADALRLPPWDAMIANLSGGEKRRVALCKLLLSKPDMLLLDEPTNHLDAESVDWLEQFLARFPGTVVAVTHDRYFLDNAAEWILELDRGHGIPWKGNYSSLAGAEGASAGEEAKRRPRA